MKTYASTPPENEQAELTVRTEIGDLRPQVFAQQRLHAMADASVQAVQMRSMQAIMSNSPQAQSMRMTQMMIRQREEKEFPSEQIPRISDVSIPLQLKTGMNDVPKVLHSNKSERPVFQAKSSRVHASGKTLQRAVITNYGPVVDGVRSEVKHTPGYFLVDPKTPGNYAPVGVEMNATLYQESPIEGSPVGAQWTWMDPLKRRAASTVIRGHLLNHDLGGPGLPYNLFPISNAANSEHSNKVEQKVKGLLYGSTAIKKAGGAAGKLENKVKVQYDVKVTDRDDTAMKATFECKWYREQNGDKDVDKKENISSELGKKSKYTFGKGEKEVPPDTWAKGRKAKIGEDAYPEVDKDIGASAEEKAQFDPANGALGAREIKVVAVREGSDFIATPFWKRMSADGVFGTYKAAADKIIGSWIEKQRALTDEKGESKYRPDEIDDAIDIGIRSEYDLQPLPVDDLDAGDGGPPVAAGAAVAAAGRGARIKKPKIPHEAIDQRRAGKAAEEDEKQKQEQKIRKIKVDEEIAAQDLMIVAEQEAKVKQVLAIADDQLAGD